MADHEKYYGVTFKLVETISKLPIVHVDREDFLRHEFGDGSQIAQILAEGPQSVYPVEELERRARAIIADSTAKTSMISFLAGLPSSPLTMTVSGPADMAQYFAFALNLAQKIAYIFGEQELFSSQNEAIAEADKRRIIIYLGVMINASGASALISRYSTVVGQNLGKRLAAQTLSDRLWFQMFQKVAALLGKKVTKSSVEKIVTKAVPVIGGVISGGITYFSFRPVGNRLVEVLAKNLKETVTPTLDTIDKPVIDGEFEELK